MKEIVLTHLIFLISLNAFAGARDYRINPRPTANGFAVAWGVPGQKIDFEELEKDEKKTADFIKTADIQNYLVDLETDKILLNLTSPGDDVDFRLGYNFGNRFTMSLSDIVIANISPYVNSSVAVLKHHKWHSELSEIILLENTDGNVKVAAEIKDVEEALLTAIRAKLTPDQVKRFNEGALSLSIERVVLKDAGSVNLISIESVVPKSNDAGVKVSAYVKISVKEGKSKAQVLSLKFQKNI